jgi:outer membrane protein OmpA-like peptidoglycan-associated protein
LGLSGIIAGLQNFRTFTQTINTLSMKNIAPLLVFIFTVLCIGRSQGQNTANDGDWSKRYVFLKGTAEAEFMIRVGDVDNLGFGWPKDFNPFCGTPTPRHPFPWKADSLDVSGMDRILLGDSYVCKTGGDGYSASCSEKTKVVPFIIPLTDLKSVDVRAVKMQVFIDDFQSPSRNSIFSITLNGKRFVAMEQLIRSIDQTGPIGKLITVDVSPTLLSEFKKDTLKLMINDYISKAGDGFAVDFIKLLINPTQEIIYKGSLSGLVTDQSNIPLDSVEISIEGLPKVMTNDSGAFHFNNIQSGLRIIEAYKKGYKIAYKNADVICDKNSKVKISLQLSKKVMYEGEMVSEGALFTMNHIQFEVGKAELSATSKAELDKIFAFLKLNGAVDIELNGYTSSEGEPAFNTELSLMRVDACKQYLVSKGISEKRIFTRGWGPENPVAPNDTEANRAKNRRVEMRIARIR